MDIEGFKNKYCLNLKERLEDLNIESFKKIIELLSEAKERGRHIFILGNGGSSATASHFVNDLNKLASANSIDKFKAISLTDNTPWITALANDETYENIFSKQLENFLEEGDLVIAITGSGNSKNLLNAINFAKEKKAKTIGILGFDGGNIKELLDEYVLFEDNHYGRIEDGHGIICHMIANYFKERGN